MPCRRRSCSAHRGYSAKFWLITGKPDIFLVDAPISREGQSRAQSAYVACRMPAWSAYNTVCKVRGGRRASGATSPATARFAFQLSATAGRREKCAVIVTNVVPKLKSAHTRPRVRAPPAIHVLDSAGRRFFAAHMRMSPAAGIERAGHQMMQLGNHKTVTTAETGLLHTGSAGCRLSIELVRQVTFRHQCRERRTPRVPHDTWQTIVTGAELTKPPSSL